MDLFNQNSIPNILPFDGEVIYYGTILSISEAQKYFQKLALNIQWKNNKAIIFGKLIITKRKVAWYDERPFEYTYSKTPKKALSWTKELLKLKKIVEENTRENIILVY